MRHEATQASVLPATAPADYGIDLAAILDEVRPHLAGKTSAEVGEAGGLNPVVVSQLFTRNRPASLGAVAALADAAGGRLVVKFEPPAKPRASKPKTAKGKRP
ncbi:hypothetical protein [Allorhodopirellula heiligendammensis]|uniref:HTH cro/C1-type domain-containing protein n=1 Tax=Allorhodopirellula heiligendammensis TaxID=2714739 RepID=A0A5C6BWV0_9BACT|nr:hypothetical protein [Allorhodopirellula heiligendammensis]TWU16312.1 hypothetical protein Poly21_35170 [Allorhodopirellula heiligendammensis]